MNGLNEVTSNQISRLVEASSDGDITSVKRLIAQSVNINGENEEGDTGLQIASFYGYEDIILYLLKKNADIDFVSKHKNSFTALHCACTEGHLQIVSLLLERGADQEIKTNDAQQTCLFLCCHEWTCKRYELTYRERR